MKGRVKIEIDEMPKDWFIITDDMIIIGTKEDD